MDVIGGMEERFGLLNSKTYTIPEILGQEVAPTAQTLSFSHPHTVIRHKEH